MISAVVHKKSGVYYYALNRGGNLEPGVFEEIAFTVEADDMDALSREALTKAREKGIDYVVNLDPERRSQPRVEERQSEHEHHDSA